MKKFKKENGFIGFALIVVISIFSIFLIFNFSHSSFYLYGFLKDELFYNQLRAYLNGCGDLVLAKYLQNLLYSGNENILLDNNFSCYVYPVESQDTYKIFRIKGNLDNFTLYLKIIFDPGSRNVILWQFLSKI